MQQRSESTGGDAAAAAPAVVLHDLFVQHLPSGRAHEFAHLHGSACNDMASAVCAKATRKREVHGERRLEVNLQRTHTVTHMTVRQPLTDY